VVDSILAVHRAANTVAGTSLAAISACGDFTASKLRMPFPLDVDADA
jgi:hypothetical protein